MMSSERAATCTHGALNREKARGVFERWDYDSTHLNALFDALEACVVPDPRLARIEALCNAAAQMLLDDPQDVGAIVNDMSLEAVRAVLRGEWGPTGE